MPDARALMRRVRRLTMADCAILIESAAIALWIEVALRLLSFSRVQRWLERVHGSSARAGAAPAVGELYPRLARLTSAAYRILPLPATCLRESLVLCALLRRRGVRARLCFGVRKDGSTLAAHAWVVCDGVATETAPSFRELHGFAG